MVFGLSTIKNIFDPNAGPILVVGGEGVVAYRVASLLVNLPWNTKAPKVRVGTKDMVAVSKLADAGADVVPFQWEDTCTYAPALEGIKAVFITMPHTLNWEAQFGEFLKTAKAAGVRHFVKLSFCHALASQADTMTNFANATRTEDPFLKVPLILMHRECDAKLMKLPNPYTYTILFASHFMSNPTVYQKDHIIKEHKFYGASAGHGVNYVSPNDCAEVAVRALLSPKDHHRVGYTLTGPSALKDDQVAKILAEHYVKDVQYVDQPLTEFAPESTDWGPALDVAFLEYVKATGIEENLMTHDISKTCGHPAESFEDYLEHQDFMTPQELPPLGGLVV